MEESNQPKNPIFDKDVLGLAERYITAQEREAKWRSIRWILISAIAIIYLLGSIGWQWWLLRTDAPTSYASLVRLEGPIGPAPQTNVMTMNSALEKAFADKKASGVLMLVNSPGGTGAQSLMIYQRLMELKEEYDKKLIIVAEDWLTSGAYLISLAGDAIYAPPMATVGSIGVKIESFDFSGLMEKYGVERRVFTAGDNKVRLDPFLALRDGDKEKVDQFLGDMHSQFKELVVLRRGSKLADDPLLFSGDFWTGKEAKQLGLIDGNESLFTVLENELGVSDFFEYVPDFRFSDILRAMNGR